VTADGTGDDARAGDWAAVEAGRDRLVRLAAGILRDRHEAEDLVQETLVAVWERSGHGDVRRLDAYVRRAVYLGALKRRARRRPTALLDEDAVAARAHERARAAEDDFEIGPAELERALAGLPEVQQVVIRMKYYLGLSFREIGRVLAISQNTAASRCRYALKALRRALARH
jgi:RNA polymerase sigma-70 factor (ECF subfamily)